MAWFPVLLLTFLVFECSFAFKFKLDHGKIFDHHGKDDLAVLRRHYLKKIKNVVRMDQDDLMRGKILTTSWKNCGRSGDAVQINNLTITPSPIRVPGDLHVAAGITLRQTMESPLKAVMKIEKKLFGFWIKIPCIEKKVGSCTYDDVCSLIHSKTGQCPDPLPKYGIPCRCPFKQGSYYLPESAFKLKKPEGIPTWLEDGDYRVHITLSEKGREVGCIYLEFSLKI